MTQRKVWGVRVGESAIADGITAVGLAFGGSEVSGEGEAGVSIVRIVGAGSAAGSGELQAVVLIKMMRKIVMFFILSPNCSRGYPSK